MLILVYSNCCKQEKPKEVKEEVKVKKVKVKNNEKTTENKVKVVMRETNEVQLDKSDKNKINQKRVPATSKVEKMTYIDNDEGDSYDVLTTETYYKMNNWNYLFSPIENGFEMAQNIANNRSKKVGNSYASSIKGYCIVDGPKNSGIGYFDNRGNFVTEYYNKDTKQVEVKTYIKK